MEVKVCFTCKKEKPLSEYYSNKAKSTGRYGSCIHCFKSKIKYPKSSDLQMYFDESILKEEIWEPVMVKGIVTKYKISNCGRILFANGKFGKPSFDQRGYPQIVLSVNGKRFGRRIHILVAQAFLENGDLLREVNHKDGNKLNANVSNLEYCSSKDNIRHAIDNKLRVHFSPKQRNV